MDSVEGDAVVNNRKNKVIVGYELHVKASWEGQLPGTYWSSLDHLGSMIAMLQLLPGMLVGLRQTRQ